ncbi:sigma 54-interacting transcriptional regulator [Desulfogranum japonicum]|uniref:sigma 54-interacting transcriptional regulator n=1 Tax=Desulfogranum japonicum TaxID=231447 RepID=UPI0003F5B92E|nr:sigma 54-interacting transcriptional regulator [Desulfogranum japonicum]
MFAEGKKFRLLFRDRIGIVFDITRLMLEHGINIISMEVEQEEGYAKISLEISGDKAEYPGEMLALFRTLPGIESHDIVTKLPQEKRDHWFRTLFDGISEGIISVNSKGIINTANKVACHILNTPYEDLVNTYVGEITPKNNLLMECMQKKIPISRRKSVVTGTGRVDFYGSAKPIYDSQGQFVGAVLLMKDLKEVKAMVDAVLTPIEVKLDDFIGESKTVRNLITFARRIAALDTIVSITGESGTGKELFARGIHYESGKSGPFIPVNCAALPEQLIESELFGYVDGAFTGAKKRGKPGLFEAAQNGTIFLDEIGDMPPGPQAKILRVLQDGFVRRIGGVEEIPVNARVITATNKNLGDMVATSNFREDLFYRINVLNIHIPPLRKRIPDIAIMATTFLNRFNRKLEKTEQTISPAALEKLTRYSWPGNVRELQNVIERASIISDSYEIPAQAIHVEENKFSEVPFTDAAEKVSLKTMVGNYEKNKLLEALNSTPTIRQAAQHLKISHTALIRKIDKYMLCHDTTTSLWSTIGTDK